MYRRPVADVIRQFAPITLSVALTAFVLEIAIAIPLGILAARKQYTRTDYAITAMVFVGISLPIFFFAAVLKRVFGYYGLNLLPTSGMLTARITYRSFSMAKLLDYARHQVLPVACFVITGMGSWLRYTRTMMIETLGSDYVRTARAKGVPEFKVVYSHAFRNALIPIVTMLGMSLPGLFSGAAITEGIFALGGLGSIALRASYMSDVPYLMGFNLFIAVCTVAGNLLSDILYAVVDPRVRLG
jgi:peptide/nickel transport system permease protein